MKELSLNILDIAQNSVKAGAAHIDISLIEQGNIRALTIEDDGCGMPPEMVRAVTDPFTTTRTTRPVGMGIPLLKLAAEQAGGTFRITSRQGENHGTCVFASFQIDHIDCVPVGDLALTMVTLVQGSPDIDFTLDYRTQEGKKELDTAAMREILGPDVPLDAPAVLGWIHELLSGPFAPEP